MSLTKAEIEKQQKVFESAIDSALDFVKTIHISTLLDVPEDMRERLENATNAGTLLISDNGDIQFVKKGKKK